MVRAYRWLHHEWMATRAEIAFVVIGVLVAWSIVLSLYVLAGKPAGDLPVIGGDTQQIVPASGPEGFPVEPFCKDPATQIKALTTPDAPGITYQMLRLRDGVPEAVIWPAGEHGDNLVATRYWYDDNHVQQSQTATVTPAARRCVETKAK